MLTDDQLAARIGPRLRAELTGLPAPDMLAALRRRQEQRARRARATAALTALPVAAMAAVAVAVAHDDSPAAHLAVRPAGHAASPAATVITLDGYMFGIPPGFRMQKLGAGYEASGPGIAHMTIFAESFPHPLPAADGRYVPVSVGARPGLWSGQPAAGELLVPLPSRSDMTYLVIKALGPSVTENAVVSFASQINFGNMRVINVACPPNCG